MTSCHNRMRSHAQGHKYKLESNPLFRHDRDVHNGEIQEYTTRVVSKEKSIFPLTMLEGLHIEAQIEGTSLNERNEYGRGKLVRLTATRE